jgi:hypothetical protein
LPVPARPVMNKFFAVFSKTSSANVKSELSSSGAFKKCFFKYLDIFICMDVFPWAKIGKLIINVRETLKVSLTYVAYFSGGSRPLSHAQRVMALKALIAPLENRTKRGLKGRACF